MNEDDTFKALKKVPYDQMPFQARYDKWRNDGNPAHYDKFLDHALSEFGWTREEFIIEINARSKRGLNS